MKSQVIAIILGMGVLLLSSCEKKAPSPESSAEQVSTKIVDVTLQSDKSLEYVVGESTQTAEITSDASHALLSKVSIVPSSGNSAYVYVPDSAFTGNDSVTVVVGSHLASGGCGKGHGKSHEGAHEQQKKILFRIKVCAASTVK